MSTWKSFKNWKISLLHYSWLSDKCKSKEKEVIVSTGFLFFDLPTCVSKTRPHESEFAITDKIRQEMIRIVKANWIGPVLAIDW